MSPERVWHEYFLEALRAFLRAENARPDDVDVMRAAKVAELAFERFMSRWGQLPEAPRERKTTAPGLRALARPPIPREEP